MLGLWLGLLVASWIFATLEFRTVDRVLGPELRPEVEDAFAGRSAAERRAVLRHLASEVNRALFRTWGPLQLGVGVLACALLWRTGGWPRALVGAALAVVAAQALLLTPPIVELGRSVDFVARPLPAELGRRFGRLHAAYVLGDALKALLLVAAAWLRAR